MHIRNVAFASVAVAVFAMLAPTAAAWAQAFPDRPITLIVPWPPGGSTDRHLRTLAEIAGRHLGQPIVVQNQPGAAGTLGPTILRRGVKLDAQVHIGHNCEVGENTIIAAQSGLAGSVILGKNVLIGGQVGIADHLTVGEGARIAAKSGVIGDVPAGATIGGYPAVERHRWLRGLAELYRIAGRQRSVSAPLQLGGPE